MKPLILCVLLAAAAMLPAAEPEPEQEKTMNILTVKEQVIVDIGAAVARGEQNGRHGESQHQSDHLHKSLHPRCSPLM